MKVALITDTHWGVRNDSQVFLEANRRFMNDVFFPKLMEERIQHVIHLGDLVDRRKYINFNTARRLRHDFLEPLNSRDDIKEVHIIAGNHDTYYKNTNEINALRELTHGYEKINIYDTNPVEINIGGLDILLLPWICDENRKETLDAIKRTKAQVAMGHLELQGFEMYRGSMVSHGDDPGLFDRFDLVCSGHYHHRSSSGSIHYLGSHAEFTWSDYNDARGFHILDTETRELEFIENPYRMFEKIFYDDSEMSIDEINSRDFDMYRGMCLKVVIKNKTNPYMFDMFIDRLEKVNPADLQIVEDHLNLGLVEDEDIVDEAEDTLTIFRKYVNNMTIDISKEKLNKTITEVYAEALELK